MRKMKMIARIVCYLIILMVLTVGCIDAPVVNDPSRPNIEFNPTIPVPPASDPTSVPTATTTATVTPTSPPTPTPTSTPKPMVGLYTIKDIHGETASVFIDVRGYTDLEQGESVILKIYKTNKQFAYNTYTAHVWSEGEFIKTVNIMGWGQHKIDVIYDEKVCDTKYFLFLESPVKLTVTTVDITSGFNHYLVSGSVRNSGVATAEFVLLTIQLYDVDGVLIGEDATYAYKPNLKSRETSEFDKIIDVTGYDGEYHSHKVFASYHDYYMED